MTGPRNFRRMPEDQYEANIAAAFERGKASATTENPATAFEVTDLSTIPLAWKFPTLISSLKAAGASKDEACMAILKAEADSRGSFGANSGADPKRHSPVSLSAADAASAESAKNTKRWAFKITDYVAQAKLQGRTINAAQASHELRQREAVGA